MWGLELSCLKGLQFTCPRLSENYDIGNRKLLAVGFGGANWLELLMVWMDHKSLEYFLAKRLNSWQAHWSFFFTRLNFKLSYRPGLT